MLKSGKKSVNFWCAAAFAAVFSLFFLSHSVFAAKIVDRPLLDRNDFTRIDSNNRVYLSTILDNGCFIAVSVNKYSQGVRLFFLNAKGKIQKWYDFPSSKVEYISSSSDGKKMVIYSQENYSFYWLDTRHWQWKLFAARRSASPGFALYGGGKSRMKYCGDSLLAWGYYYDRAGDYVNEAVVKINPQKEDEEAFEILANTAFLRSIGDIYLPGAKEPKCIDANGRYLILLFTKDDEGRLVAYDTEKGNHFLVDRFSAFYGGNIAREGSRFACVIKPVGSSFNSILFVYDLEGRKILKAVPGKFFNPVFDDNGERVAAGIFGELAGRVVCSKIEIISVMRPEVSDFTLTFPGSIRILDWRFTGRRDLTVFAGDEIYREAID